MKFLCEQCKAKYQISDEKVAGKTVRMKCRKCGHMIEVRAEVTETSVAKALPSSESAAAPRVDAKPGTPGAPGTSLSGTSAGASSGAPRPPQRPPPAKGALATSLSAARRTDPNAAAVKLPSAAPGALAGAFQKSVSKSEDSALDMLSMSTSNEWYVAINGVPVGPVRVSELRRKAAMGAVTEDSLVWQEGLEEWRPVRAVTELAGLVREALANGRPSLLAPEPSTTRPSMTPPPPGAHSPSRPPAAPRPSGIPPRPANRPLDQPNAAMARNNVVPFTGMSRLATAEKLDHQDEPDVDFTEVQSLPADALSALASGAAFGSQERSSLVAADPFAASPAAGANPFSTNALAGSSPALGSPLSGSHSLSSPISLGAPIVVTESRTKKGPPWIPIAMVAAATAFGVVAAIAIFFKAPPAPVVIQMAPSAAPAPPPPSATAPATADSVVAIAPSASADKPAAGGRVGTGAGTKPATGGTTAKSGVDLSSLLQGGAGGPATGGGSGGSGGGGGGGGSSLDGPAIESVVRSRAAGVKRTCWERGGSQQSSVNVTCRVTIAANGSVSSASAKGEDPAVTKCIENSVRAWTFPASGGTTTVDIPFHFVRQ